MELIEYDKAAHGKAALEIPMILNHRAAIELLVENISSIVFNRYTLLDRHSALAETGYPTQLMRVECDGTLKVKEGSLALTKGLDTRRDSHLPFDIKMSL